MMADGEMGVEVTWALSRHAFLIAIAGVILHDMGCGRRGGRSGMTERVKVGEWREDGR